MTARAEREPILFTIVGLTGPSVLGNSLPAPYDTYVPMLAGNDWVRDEPVRLRALKQVPAPCVALFGDSRVAFNIAAAEFDKVLPTDCKAQNYGFPTLTRRQIVNLADDLSSINMIVISLSETMLASEAAIPTKALLEHRWLRWLYLGHQKFLRFFPTFNMTLPDDGWLWLSAAKRWRNVSIEERVLVALPSHEHEAADMAASYFRVNRPVDEVQLAAFLATMAERAQRLVVVLPPSERRFQRVAEQYNNSMQQFYWRTIIRLAEKAGAMIVDCSRACVDQTGFGDPVHLNASGVKRYSAHLSEQILLQLATGLSASALPR